MKTGKYTLDLTVINEKERNARINAIYEILEGYISLEKIESVLEHTGLLDDVHMIVFCEKEGSDIINRIRKAGRVVISKEGK